MIIRVLALGDVVGEGGCAYLYENSHLEQKKKELNVHLVIANGENSAKGNGITPKSADMLFDAGVDIITGGNHTWQRREIYSRLEDDGRMLRPANFPGRAEGSGSTVVDICGCKVLIFNLSGNAFMNECVASPYECADSILSMYGGDYDVSLLDFHAETTSEKAAMGRYLDGRVSAVFGTHTHIQTSDARVLPGGTGYITDLGMCGSENGVLGVKTECILHKFLVHTPCRFEEAEGALAASGAVFDINTATGKCERAAAVRF